MGNLSDFAPADHCPNPRACNKGFRTKEGLHYHKVPPLLEQEFETVMLVNGFAP